MEGEQTRGKNRVKPFLQWTPSAEKWVSWGLFPFLNHLSWEERKLVSFKQIRVFLNNYLDYFLYSSCSLPRSFWDYKETFHHYAVSFGSFCSLFFAIWLSFSHCWGKTFQFPLPKNFKGVFFQRNEFVFSHRQKGAWNVMLSWKCEEKNFVLHFDSPEISQANLIVWLVLLTKEWSSMKRIRQEGREGRGGGWLWMWKLYLHTHARTISSFEKRMQKKAHAHIFYISVCIMALWKNQPVWKFYSTEDLLCL